MTLTRYVCRPKTVKPGIGPERKSPALFRGTLYEEGMVLDTDDEVKNPHFEKVEGFVPTSAGVKAERVALGEQLWAKGIKFNPRKGVELLRYMVKDAYEEKFTDKEVAQRELDEGGVSYDKRWGLDKLKAKIADFRRNPHQAMVSGRY